MQYEDVKDYYGRVLKTNADLQTSACCDPGAMPEHIKRLAANVPTKG